MNPETVCRLCLARDVPMHNIADSPLQGVYEKLTDVSLDTAHGAEVAVACYICYSQLRKSHNLMVKSVRANKVFTQILQEGIISEESMALLNREMYQLNSTLSITPIRLLTITGSEISLVSLVEVNIDNSSSASHRSTEEIEMETSISVERLKVEEAADEDVTIIEDIDSGRLTNVEDCVESDGGESVKSKESDGATLEDCDVTSDISNAETLKIVLEEEDEPERTMAAYMLRSANKTVPQNTMHFDDLNIDDVSVASNETKVEDSVPKIKKHSGKGKYECVICERKFIDKHGLNRHFRIHTGERRFKCHMCKASFKQKAHLGNHLKTHTNERPFECTVCKVRFNQKVHLEGHMLTHSEERPFKCEVCKQRFKRKDHMKQHLRIHTGEKPYECHICHLRFTLKPTLTSHIRTHTGEKPFQCHVCPRRFTQRTDVKKHMRIHTGDKPFKCLICQRIFSIKGNLTKHLKTHGKERPFKCVDCPQRFKRKDHLRYHVTTHTGEKPYECDNS